MSLPISYIRSSSYNAHSMCPMKYFAEYVLGWTGKSGKAADMGTVVHKAMEVLAHIKLAEQNGKDFYIDDIAGKVSRDSPGLNELIEIIYNHYSEHSDHHIWGPADFNKCKKWFHMALDFNNGQMNPLNQNIVIPEQHFDIEIKSDWGKYTIVENGEEVERSLRLKGTIDLITKVNKNTHEIIDYKGLPLSTLIPTIHGWTTMKEIEVGDIIYDKDGNNTTVIGKSQVKYKDCFKITFDDTSSVVCDDEHIWLLDDGSEKIVTDLKINDKIDVTKPLICTKKDLPIDPYVLGVWLGDGRNRNGEISGEDNFIFEEIERRGFEIGRDISSRSTESCMAKTVYGLSTQLRALSLLHNKHIPDIYFRGSIKQRLDLLRGLMDSDGYANVTRKQGVFMNCNERLSDDVKKLLTSLGQRPYKCKTKAKGFGLEVDAYPIFFRPIGINPFLIPRKANKILKTWENGKSSKRQIKKIEKVNKQHTQCIMVDSPSHTYLCTENMIPTHNTGQRKNWGTGNPKEYEDFMEDFQLRLYHYAHMILFPEIPNVLVTIYYIRDGGPFTVALGRSDIHQTLEMIREKFEKIRDTETPRVKYGPPCKTFCHLGKETFEDTNVPPIMSTEGAKLTRPGNYMCKCDQLKYTLEHRSTELVILNMTKEGHRVDHYQEPGELK